MVQANIAAILSHETLHKVLFKVEGTKACRFLDDWCAARNWHYDGDSGFCFFVGELED